MHFSNPFYHRFDNVIFSLACGEIPTRKNTPKIAAKIFVIVRAWRSRFKAMNNVNRPAKELLDFLIMNVNA